MSAYTRLVRRIARYLGIGLPNRDLNLDFGLSPPSKRAQKPELSLKKLQQDFYEADKDTIKLFTLISQHLSRLNRYKTTPEKRLAHTKLCISFFYPVAHKLMVLYQEDGKVPDSKPRAENLQKIADTCGVIRTSIKHILQHDYDLSNRRYAGIRSRVHWTSFRIIEFIRFEQMIRALRYQNMPEEAWKDSNMVFNIMLAYESVEGSQRLMDKVSREENAGNSTSTIIQKPERNSLQNIYILIQITGILDFFMWPTSLQGVVESYLKNVDKPVMIVPDAGTGGGKDTVVIYFKQQRSAFYKRQKDQDKPALLMNYHIFAQQIRKDYLATGRAHIEENVFLIPRILRNLKQAYRVPILALLREHLPKDYYGRFRMGTQEKTDLRIYSGFAEVYELVNQIFYPQDEKKDAQAFKNMLAQRSAAIGEDDKATTESLWYVIENTEETFHVKTQETEYTVPMFIGSLMAFGISQEGINKPNLGVVKRIERLEPGYVNVLFRRLTSYAEPVVVRKIIPKDDENKRKKSINKPIEGLLVHNNNNGWGILIPQHPAYWEGLHIDLKRGDQKFKLQLERLQEVSQEFFMFSLLGTDLKELGVPRYPEVQTMEIPQG